MWALSCQQTKYIKVSHSVADPGCLYPIPDPDFYPSRIPDRGSRIPDLGSRIQKQQWKTGVKKNLLSYIFFRSHKFHNIELFYFWNVEEKNLGHFERIIELFTQNIVTKLSKIWVWDAGSGFRDPESGKNLFRIPDPGVKKAPDPGSRIRIRNTG
jgi:hypothetical protein